MSAASGGNSEPKQGQRSQSARGFCPRSTMRVPQPDIIEHFGNADAVPQPPERCLSRQAEIVRCCLNKKGTAPGEEPGAVPFYWVYLQGESEEEEIRQYRIILSADTASEVRQMPERCLSRKAGIVRCCLRITTLVGAHIVRPPPYHLLLLRASRSPSPQTPAPQITTHPIKKPPFHLAVRPKMWYSILSKVLLCPNHSKYFSLFLLIRRNIHAKHSDCIRKYNLCRRK